MHNHNGKGDNSMMWMMVLCCAVPIILLLFAGSTVFSGGYFWPILIGVFVAAHIWMMFRGHGKHGGTDGDEKADGGEEPKTKDEHKKGGCCH